MSDLRARLCRECHFGYHGLCIQPECGCLCLASRLARSLNADRDALDRLDALQENHDG